VPLGSCATIEIKPEVAVTATNNGGDDTLAFSLPAMGKKLAVNEGSPGESGWTRAFRAGELLLKLEGVKGQMHS
jgi:hypothetical protein